ncbi:unnamed protein product [Ectocarpus sp. 12 AP-2014]
MCFIIEVIAAEPRWQPLKGLRLRRRSSSRHGRGFNHRRRGFFCDRDGQLRRRRWAVRPFAKHSARTSTVAIIAGRVSRRIGSTGTTSPLLVRASSTLSYCVRPSTGSQPQHRGNARDATLVRRRQRSRACRAVYVARGDLLERGSVPERGARRGCHGSLGYAAAAATAIATATAASRTRLVHIHVRAGSNRLGSNYRRMALLGGRTVGLRWRRSLQFCGRLQRRLLRQGRRRRSTLCCRRRFPHGCLALGSLGLLFLLFIQDISAGGPEVRGSGRRCRPYGRKV